MTPTTGRPRPDDCTVVIVSWNGAHLLPDCLDAVLAEGAPVLVVDNASTDGTAALLARYPVEVVTADRNTGFSGGVALALEQVLTPVVALLNNDAVVRPGWLTALLAPLDVPAVAAVAGRMLLPDGRLDATGGVLTRYGYGRDRGYRRWDDGRFDAPRPVAWGCGGSLALRTGAVGAVGGVDPRFFLYYEDVDLCWRLRLAGHEVVYAPDSVAVHEHSATVGTSSLLHTYYAERNRLATLVRCATADLAVRAALRFPIGTLKLALRGSRSKAWTWTRAYLSFLVWLPALLRDRRRVRCVVTRREFQARWMTASEGGLRPSDRRSPSG